MLRAIGFLALLASCLSAALPNKRNGCASALPNGDCRRIRLVPDLVELNLDMKATGNLIAANELNRKKSAQALQEVGYAGGNAEFSSKTLNATSYSGEVTVPAVPPGGALGKQIIYIDMGVEAGKPGPILPTLSFASYSMLMFGSGGLGPGPFWAITAGYADSTGYHLTPSVRVEPGDMISLGGVLNRNGTFTSTVRSKKLQRTFQMTSGVPANVEWWFGYQLTFQTYSPTTLNCAKDLPQPPLFSFKNVKLTQNGKAWPNPPWTAGANPGTPCSLNGTTVNANQIDITWSST